MNTLVSLNLSDLPALLAGPPHGSLLSVFPATDLLLASDLRVATKQSAQFGAGGDFYEVFQQADGRVSAVVADVCGNGAEAAKVAARVRPFLRASLARGDSPALVLAALNDALVGHGLVDRFVTAVAVRVDADLGFAEAACAGHLGPFVRAPSGRVRSVDGAKGVPLGLLAAERYEEISLRLEPGDALVLVTDGVSDPLSTEGDPLGQSGLAQRLAVAPHGTTGICEALLATGAVTRDDATVLVLQLPAREATLIAA